MVLPGKGICDVKPSHSAKSLLLFEEEKLVCLHKKLTTNLAIVINYKILNSGFVKLFTNCKSCGTCSNNCNGCFSDFYLFSVTLYKKSLLRKVGFVNSIYIFDLIYLCNTNTPDLAVNQHFAGATFSYSALHGALSVLKTVLVNYFSGLMQRSCYCKPFLTGNFLTLEDELYSILRRDGQDRMLSDFVHS